jgi:hypothetical protein
MAHMICSNCGRPGIYWKDITKLSAYTYCPHCQGTNCQVPEETQCRCDLDNWQPDKRTGHTSVCPVHKAALTKSKSS